MLPRITLHNAVSLDGRLLEWGMVDIGLYYGLIGAFDEQATLAGADTLIFGAGHEGVSADEPDATPVERLPGDCRPLLVVPDSRGRIRIWRWTLGQPYWSAGVALCSSATPQEYLEYVERVGVDRITAGDDHVDLAAALGALHDRYGVERVRADSGGTLNGVLLRLRLVDEVSLLLAPVLLGDDHSRPFFHVSDVLARGAEISLRLTHQELLAGDHLWLRFRVER
jgi:2,5-diamino-6-(ribosylamino)-4(3H)-pyrimidinone 5'-phosphate reductase